MTMLRMRRWSRVIALAVLAATVRLPHVGLDDAACAPAAEGSYAPHHETDHAVRAAAQGGTDHCAICHLTRSTRMSRPAVALCAADCPVVELVAAETTSSACAAPHAQLPARAPPIRL
jgi:hypothetical protein